MEIKLTLYYRTWSGQPTISGSLTLIMPAPRYKNDSMSVKVM